LWNRDGSREEREGREEKKGKTPFFALFAVFARPASLFTMVLLLAGRSAAVLPGDDFNANSVIAAGALQQWYNRNGLWDTTEWWNAANCVEAIENVIAAGNGREYVDVLDKTFRENSGGKFLNDFYDDEGWWALVWIRAFDLTGDARYLEMAKTIFADMTSGWDTHCGGGIWWKKDRRYKNAIANELFLLVAVRLHQRTPGDSGPGSYREWAVREWDWFRASGMINPRHLVNDGLSDKCENNGHRTWTYNQGVIVGGLTELHKVTGDAGCLSEAVAIADAAIRHLTDAEGILREPCEPDRCHGADVPQFKGIFVRHLAGLYDLTRKPAYREFLVNNARAVWTRNRDAENRFGMRWSGPIDSVDAARQSSAMIPITVLAEPVTANLLFAKGSGSPAFNHEVGAPSGTLAWRCEPGRAARGFLQSGPYLASLPTGAHTVHFRIAVDATGPSATNLVFLDVRENGRGAVLARREVAWKEFIAAGEPQDFSLTFTNPTAGGPLEFRVFWNNAANAPALTLSDVTVGGSHNWTAANLAHDVGQLDGMNAWCADPLRNRTSGFLARGANTRQLSNGAQAVTFELKVDNFNRDQSKVATVSVVDVATGKILAARDLARNAFATALYHNIVLNFTAAAGGEYDFRTFWHHAPDAPRLTQRSVMVKAVEEKAQP
jgi:predicted alpha-1,6-mannanase (GH76 family)